MQQLAGAPAAPNCAPWVTERIVVFVIEMWRLESVVVLSVLVAGVYGGGQSEEDIKGFLEWYKECNGVANNVTLSQFPEMGLGVKASGSVREGDTVLYLPYTCVVSHERVLQDPLFLVKVPDDAEDSSPKRLADVVKPLNDEHSIATFLTVHSLLGARSGWNPYFRVLPRWVPVTFLWSEDELQFLEFPSVAEEAQANHERLVTRFQKLRLGDRIRALLRNVTTDSEDGASVTIPSESEVLSTFLWAHSLVGSRALTLQGTRYLVPFADMYNYRPHPSPREAAAGKHFAEHHLAENNGFRVTADRNAVQGEQLFEDYGDNDNTLYLNHHGFVPDENPFDCTSIQLPTLEGVSYGRAKVDVLRGARVIPQRAWDGSKLRPVCLESIATTPSWVFIYLHVRNMTGGALQRCKSLIREAGSRSSSPDLEKKLLKCLPRERQDRAWEKEFLKALLQGYLRPFSSTAEEDAAALERAEPPAGIREEPWTLALRYRITHKRRVQAMIDEIEATEGESSSPPGPRRLQLDDSTEVTLRRLLDWFGQAGAAPTRVEPQYVGDGMRLGVVAKEDIPEGEVYLSVPTELTMSAASAWKSPTLAPMFRSLSQRFPRGDPFHELLFHLIWEKYVNGNESFWWPYVATIPTEEDQDFPLMWTDEQLDALVGTPFLVDVLKYQRDVSRKYYSVQRAVLNEYPDVFHPDVYSEEHYRWAHAILDSRAIWWNGERHLVPLLDLVNCKEGPSPDKIHSTNLDETGTAAVTKAAWAFSKGEQVFENYGQPNHIYFLFHGFVLDPNSHDCGRLVAQGEDAPQRVLSAVHRCPVGQWDHLPTEIPADKVSKIARLVSAALSGGRDTKPRAVALELDVCLRVQNDTVVPNADAKRLVIYMGSVCVKIQALQEEELNAHAVQSCINSVASNLAAYVMDQYRSSFPRGPMEDELPQLELAAENATARRRAAAFRFRLTQMNQLDQILNLPSGAGSGDDDAAANQEHEEL